MIAVSEAVMGTILVATITASGGIIVAFIQFLKKENRSDHLTNQSILIRMHDEQSAMRVELNDRMDRIEGKVDDHIRHHAHGGKTRDRKH